MDNTKQSPKTKQSLAKYKSTPLDKSKFAASDFRKGDPDSQCSSKMNPCDRSGNGINLKSSVTWFRDSILQRTELQSSNRSENEKPEVVLKGMISNCKDDQVEFKYDACIPTNPVEFDDSGYASSFSTGNTSKLNALIRVPYASLLNPVARHAAWSSVCMKSSIRRSNPVFQQLNNEMRTKNVSYGENNLSVMVETSEKDLFLKHNCSRSSDDLDKHSPCSQEVELGDVSGKIVELEHEVQFAKISHVRDRARETMTFKESRPVGIEQRCALLRSYFDVCLRNHETCECRLFSKSCDEVQNLQNLVSARTDIEVPVKLVERLSSVVVSGDSLASVKFWNIEMHKNHKSDQRHAFAGALAGVTVSLFLHPIDTVKTVIQARKAENQSIRGIFRTILSERGIGGLYRGIGSNLVASAPISAIYTFTYEKIKEIVLPIFPKEYVSLAHCTAGGCASIATSFVYTPSERIKQQMQVAARYQNCWAAVMGVVEKGGLRSLYAGWVAVLCRNVPHSIIKFYTYESLKQWAVTLDQTTLHQNILQTLAFGALAGSTAAFFTTPFDVIKTRLQTQVPGSLQNYSSVFHVFREITIKEGFTGLYRGLLPRLIMYISQGSIFFTSYESFKRVFASE